MPTKRSGFLRSLLSPFSRPGAASSRRAGRQRRPQAFERLEERTLMTTTLYIDFGEGFQQHLVTTAGELRQNLFGPNFLPTYPDFQVIEFLPLTSTMQIKRTEFEQTGRLLPSPPFLPGTPLGPGLQGQFQNYQQLLNPQAVKQNIIDIVRRQYEPFDVNVVPVAARSQQEIKAALAQTPGADAYVLVGSPFAGATTIGDQLGLYGISADVDFDLGANLNDEVVIVDAHELFDDATFELFTFPRSVWPYDVALADVVSHEAAHSFSLQHTADQGLLTESDNIVVGSASLLDLTNVTFYTRFPLADDFNPALQRIVYDEMAAKVGLRPNGPAYVTGTGAFDLITITSTGFSAAQVTVEAHGDNTFASLIDSFTYDIDTTNGILIEGGREIDRIVIDPRLGNLVRVRGGQGADELVIRGQLQSLTDATFTPATSYAIVPGYESVNTRTDRQNPLVSYSGEIVAGLTTVRYTEFDDAGSVLFENLASVQFRGSAGFDNLTIATAPAPAAAGTNEINGAVSGVGFPNMRYANVRSVVIDTGATAVTDAVTVSALAATGLAQFTVSTGPGNDFINLTTGNLQLGAAGATIFDFGTGQDTLNAYAGVDWTLTDAELSSLGGRVQLRGLLGETANLVGGPNANTFNVGFWSGRGQLRGEGGSDTVAITRDTNYSFGADFLNITGGGSFTLHTIERLNLTGGPGSNTFMDFGWNGRGTLDGGLGAADMIVGFRDSHFTLSDTLYTAGNNNVFGAMSLVNVELASLTGGAGFNQFDVSLRTRPAAINGAGGQDVIAYRNDSNMLLTNDRLSVTGAANTFFTLAGIEVAHLTGGAGPNTFTVSQWAGSGFMVGGGGSDTFNISTGSLDAIAGFWNILGGLDVGDTIIINDTLGGFGNYIVTPNSVRMAPGRRFGGVFFDGTTENVQLNANNAANRIDVTPGLDVTPNQSLTISVNGNLPSVGLFGDVLVVHTAFTGPPTSSPPPGARNGRYAFAGYRDVIFADIEQHLTAP
jgi:hypothetical protein